MCQDVIGILPQSEVFQSCTLQRLPMLNATGAPFDNNSLTACKCPTCATMCKAVAPCTNINSMSAHQLCPNRASVTIKQFNKNVTKQQLSSHKLSIYIIVLVNLGNREVLLNSRIQGITLDERTHLVTLSCNVGAM